MNLPYCTNVHAGRTLADNFSALERYAVEVRKHLGVDGLLPIGWWLSAPALIEFTKEPDGKFDRLREWFLSRGLLPVTLNGFPLGDFHGQVVKHSVYRPDWSQPARLACTQALAAIMVAFSSPGTDRSISTVPIGWPTPDTRATVKASAEQLVTLVEHLRSLRERTGAIVHVDLEPEPGAILERYGDVVRFFADHLLPTAHARGVSEQAVRDHIGVCHDICHAAVMFEDQSECLRAYRSAGIRLGKVQVSSAIVVDFDALAPGDRSRAFTELEAFAEDRYLHQTMIRSDDGGLRFFDDLPKALASASSARPPMGEWRIHYHVPVYMSVLGEESSPLRTTQRQIREALTALGAAARTTTVEVETYAWSVLPMSLRPDDLAAGIAAELKWTAQALRTATAALV